MTKELSDHQKKSSLKRSLNRFSQNIKEVSTHTSHAVRYWHMVAIAVLFAVLLWSMIFLVRIEAHKCHIDQEELDNCAKGITFFSTERRHFPATNPQLDEYCKEKTASIQCLKKYALTCLKIDKVQKRYVKKFVSNYRKQLDHVCLRRSEREKFMSYSKCLSDENLIRNATRCTESHRKRLLYIAQYVSDDLRIAAACCSLHLRHSCFNSVMSTEKCDRQVQRFVLDQTEGPYRSLISNVCSPYYMSVKACNSRIDADVWRDMKEASVINDTPQQQPGSRNSSSHDLDGHRNEPIAVEDGESLKAKLDEITFRDSFLAMIFIIRHND